MTDYDHTDPRDLTPMASGNVIYANWLEAVRQAVAQQLDALGIARDGRSGSLRNVEKIPLPYFSATNVSGGAVVRGNVVVPTGALVAGGGDLPVMTKATAASQVPAFVVRDGGANGAAITVWQPGITAPVTLANPGAATVGASLGATASAYTATVGNSGIGMLVSTTALTAQPANTYLAALGASSSSSEMFAAYNNTGGAVSAGDVVVSSGTYSGTLLKVGKATSASQVPAFVVAVGGASTAQIYLWHAGIRRVTLNAAPTVGQPVGTANASLVGAAGNNGLGVAVGTVDSGGYHVLLSGGANINALTDLLYDAAWSLRNDGKYTYDNGDVDMDREIQAGGVLAITTGCLKST